MKLFRTFPHVSCRRREWRFKSRAFSLLELAVVIAAITILTTLAVPTLGNHVRRAYLAGTADQAAAFLARAQAEAMSSRRCVKVYVSSGTLKADRLNSYDCDTVSSTVAAVQIDNASGVGKWINFATMTRDSTAVTVTISTVPSHLTATYLGGTEENQIRFRPNGRVWNDDTNYTDDDGVVTASLVEGSTTLYKRVVVEAQGDICVLGINKVPTGSGNNLSCP